MAYEDLAHWSNINDGTFSFPADTRVDFTDINQRTPCWLSDQKGAGSWNRDDDFSCLFTFYADINVNDEGCACFWGISENHDSEAYGIGGGDKSIWLDIEQRNDSGVKNRIHLLEVTGPPHLDGFGQDQPTGPKDRSGWLADSFTYYVTVAYDSVLEEVTASFYTDAARTALGFSLNIALDEPENLEDMVYLHTLGRGWDWKYSTEWGSWGSWDGYLENLDCDLPGPFAPRSQPVLFQRPALF
ncbi:hypothetical protein GF373_17820 [bacterium]|nr:hypothetical protein [bacterium]